jgi:UDP-N-acetylmuramoyl-tripeptide--D-alanyl-D-alanine ligase
MIADAARRTGGGKVTIIEFDELEPLVEWLTANLSKNDVVLIKGSHGLRMDRITSSLEVRS